MKGCDLVALQYGVAFANNKVISFVLSLQGLVSKACQACSAQTFLDLPVLLGVVATAISLIDQAPVSVSLFFIFAWKDSCLYI